MDPGSTDQPGPPRTSWFLTGLNVCNCLASMALMWTLLSSQQRSERAWGMFQIAPSVGMFSLSAALARSQRGVAVWSAAFTVLASLVEMFVGVPLGASKDHSLGGGMVLIFGLVLTAILTVIPTLTLFVLLRRRGW
jgi:hypothetical protein